MRMEKWKFRSNFQTTWFLSGHSRILPLFPKARWRYRASSSYQVQLPHGHWKWFHQSRDLLQWDEKGDFGQFTWEFHADFLFPKYWWGSSGRIHWCDFFIYEFFLTEKLRHHHHAPVIRGRWSDGRSLQRFCSRLHCTPCHKYQFVCPGEKRKFLWIRHLMM